MYVANPSNNMRRTIRISPLAREMGVSSKSLVAILQTIAPRFGVKSASSVVFIEPNQEVFWNQVRDCALEFDKQEALSKVYFQPGV